MTDDSTDGWLGGWVDDGWMCVDRLVVGWMLGWVDDR